MAEERLPGSQVSVRTAVQRSRLVVIVKDVDMGLTDPDFPGKAYYGNVKLKVVKSLKGEALKDILPVGVMVQTLPPEAAEATPSKDKEYLFFLEGSAPRTPKAIKVLRATEDNVLATKEALKTVDP